ncbi:MAG TPA: DUF1801 domain-containing protein [Devosia sp.]|nr:DUF1801 domain-containing protein [Devosia sp.]
MSKAKPIDDKRLQALVEDWQQVAPQKAAIVSQVRELVKSIFPGVGERVMYGGIFFSLNSDFGGVFVYKTHVSVEFTNGAHMRDPEHHLEGSGKLRRHIKLRSIGEIESKQLAFYVRQASDQTISGPN